MIENMRVESSDFLNMLPGYLLVYTYFTLNILAFAGVFHPLFL